MGKFGDIKNFSYHYAMGRIRAREKHMLTKRQFDRMIEAKTADDAYEVLLDAGYGDGGQGAKSSAADYERLLDAEGKKLSAFISEITPEPKLLDIFLIRYDYHNIKVMLKSEFANVPGKSFLSDSGLAPIAALTRIVDERLLSELHPALSGGVRAAIEAYQYSMSLQTPDPRIIDIALDRAMYAHMLIDAHMLGCGFIGDLIRIFIDTANMGTFLRMREMGGGVGLLREVFIPDGEIEFDFYERHFNESPDGFVGAMRNTRYDKLCKEGVGSYRATGRFTHLEKAADDFITEHIKRAKLLGAGPEIIAAHFQARITELRNIRIVMVGKINSIGQDAIKEMLREPYV